MRRRIFIVFILFMVTVFALSCSRPASEPHRYLDNFDESTVLEEPIDLSTITEPEDVEPGPEDELDITPHFFKEISPQDLPRAMHHFAVVIELLEDKAKELEEFGDTPFKFRINRSVFANGDIIHKNGGDVSPIPLFKSWDSRDFKNIGSVDSWVHHSNIVEIRSRRRTREGNWYFVRLPHAGMNQISGWVHEDMLSID